MRNRDEECAARSAARPSSVNASQERIAVSYLPRTTSIPASTRPSCVRGNLPARSVSSVLSKLTICETLATESFGRPVNRVESTTLPGAPPHLVLLVSGTQTTVAMRLRFNESPCTTTTGLRNPGPEPAGSGSSAHQTSPWEITTRCAPARAEMQQTRTDPVRNRSRSRLDSSIP